MNIILSHLAALKMPCIVVACETARLKPLDLEITNREF